MSPPPLFKTLCLPVTLHTAWKAVKLKNSAGGIDGLSVRAFEEDLKVNLEALRRELIAKTWNPEPYLRVEIDKNETEKRKLGLLSVRDKIVQQAIKSLIEPRMDKMFLNHSYGYRPGRGPTRAIHRVMHIVGQTKKGWIAKLDIDNYFDTIKHEQLFQRLHNYLKDEETVRLINLCVKTGVVTPQLKWDAITEGVPQGAVLSPLLANFYLHPFDQFVVSKTANYVRYADDFIVVAESEEQIQTTAKLIEEKLEKEFSLKLNDPLITNLETGVEFLGITIKRSGLSLSEKKKTDLEGRICSISFTGLELSEKSKETLRGICAYYAKLLPQPYLKEWDSKLIWEIHEWIKANKQHIPNKTVLSENLKKLDFFCDETTLSKPVLIRDFIETYLKQSRKNEKNKEKKKKTTKADNKKLIDQKKREYQKREIEGSELVVSTTGSFIGKTNRGITIRLKGQPLNKKPNPALKHITVTGQGVSISSNAIQYCISQRIPIDFFDAKGKHYASILSPVSMDGLLWQQQTALSLEKRVDLAGKIILGKLKNQENLIKYYHKYHKGQTNMLSARYPELMLQLEACISRVKAYSEMQIDYATFFMSQEAVGAISYWEYVRLLILDDGVDFYKREHQGATDLMNSLLNYGYAILYARVWDAVLSQKLNPSMGVLHAPQPGKPTFVFDIVELFRTQAVDRMVISLIQKGETTLKMHNDLLSEPTKRALTECILERLNRYEKYRGEEIQFVDIIRKQVREIAAFISGESKTFKPYIAKW